MAKRKFKKKQRGPGRYLVQINAVKKILKTADLYKDQNQYPKYSNFKFSDFKSMKYDVIFKKVLNERFYDYELKDNSLLQFIYRDDLNYSFHYSSSPFSEEIKINHMFTGSYTLKENFLIIHYDYRPSTYKEFCHPCAHFHFGIGNQIRIGIKKQLNPISFVFFILRQCYPEEWLYFIKNNNDEKIYKNIRHDLHEIPNKTFNDEKELVLH